MKMSDLKKVSKKHLQFDVEFIPYEQTPHYREVQENQATVDVKDPSIKSNASKGREFSSVAYSGDMIMNHPFWGNLIFDTANLKAKQQIPILLNHDHTKIVGFGNLKVKNSQILVDGKIFHTSEYGKQVQNFADEGFQWQQSVHIEPEYIEKVPAGKKLVVNSKEFILDKEITVFKNSVIKEASFVPLGADANTSASIFSGENDIINIKEIKMENEVIEPAQEPKIEDAKQPTAIYEFKEGSYVPVEPKVLEITQADYDFACSCEKKKEVMGDNQDDKQKKIDELMEEIKMLQEAISKMKKEKKFSLISSLQTKHGLKFSDETVKVLENLEEKEIEAMAKDLSAAKPKTEIDPSLLTEDKKEFSSFSYDPNSAESIRAEANKLMNKFAAEGKTIDYLTAHKMVRNFK